MNTPKIRQCFRDRRGITRLLFYRMRSRKKKGRFHNSKTATVLSMVGRRGTHAGGWDGIFATMPKKGKKLVGILILGSKARWTSLTKSVQFTATAADTGGGLDFDLVCAGVTRKNVAGQTFRTFDEKFVFSYCDIIFG
jgi:hypothetical protein